MSGSRVTYDILNSFIIIINIKTTVFFNLVI